MQDTSLSPVTTVWIIQPDSYYYNDNYVVNSVVPTEFYLTEREAKCAAGYMNMQILFELWDWFSPPIDSEICKEFFENEYDPVEDSVPGELLNKVYQMSLDDACLFFASLRKIQDLLDDVGHGWPRYQALYKSCKLNLSGHDSAEDEEMS